MIKFKDYTNKEIFLFASCLLMMLVFVLRDQLITPFILLYFTASLSFMKGAKFKVGRSLAITLVFFYALHFISLLYSDNWGYAGADLMTKLSYLVFPLFILFVRKGFELIMKGIRWGLIIGSFISMVFSFLRAFITEGGALTGEAFNANFYGLNMHPSYLALLFIIACALLWQEQLKWRGALLLKVGYTGMVVLSMFYLRSLGAFVCVAAIMCAFPFWKALKSRNWKWLLILPLYAVIFALGIASSAKIANDVDTSLNRLSDWNESSEQFLLENKNNMESNTVRLVTWTLSARIVGEHPFGVGIGDVKDELEVSYRRYGYTFYAHHKFNPHNQFLQTGIAIGWLGIVVLLLFLILMLYYTFKANHLALFIAALCLFVSCLFESMLERQVGVILTGILIMYIVFYLRSEQNKKLNPFSNED